MEEDHMMEKKGNGTKLSPALTDLVQREVNKILKGEQYEQVNFTHILEFASNICSNLNIVFWYD